MDTFLVKRERYEYPSYSTLQVMPIVIFDQLFAAMLSKSRNICFETPVRFGVELESGIRDFVHGSVAC